MSEALVALRVAKDWRNQLAGVFQLSDRDARRGAMTQGSESFSGEIADSLALLNDRSLHAAIAAIEILDFSLTKLQSAWSVLPDGEEKDKLEKEKVRLAFALYDVRVTVLRLFPTFDSATLALICSQPAQDRV